MEPMLLLAISLFIIMGWLTLDIVAFFSQAAHYAGLSPWLAPAALITPYVTVYTILKATFITLKNNSISWRGSRYPLDELRRKNRSLL